MGLITTVSPYGGSLSPQPIYYPIPQHTYQHTYKLAYYNSITSFSISNLANYRKYHAQTALHELVDNHVFLASARCKWHSNPNFWGEMEWKRFVWCASRLVGASLLKFLEGFVFVSGMNALNVKLVGDLWHECSIETMDPPRALFSKSPCWRSKRTHALSSSPPKLASNWRDESDD